MHQEQVLHEKKKAKKHHKNISREHFSFTNATGNFAGKQTPTDMSRHLYVKKFRIFMCEQNYENKKMVITKILGFFCKR